MRKGQGKNEKAVSHVVGYVFSWKPSINEVRTESGGLVDYITDRFDRDSDKWEGVNISKNLVDVSDGLLLFLFHLSGANQGSSVRRYAAVVLEECFLPLPMLFLRCPSCINKGK